jgi:hypothetical protein
MTFANHSTCLFINSQRMAAKPLQIFFMLPLFSSRLSKTNVVLLLPRFYTFYGRATKIVFGHNITLLFTEGVTQVTILCSSSCFFIELLMTLLCIFYVNKYPFTYTQ